MSAFAGALGLRLDKRGLYVLNAGGREAETADLLHALNLAQRTFALATLFLLLPWETHA
ncbi:cobalamin biosynthesis protein [Deinococcus alpinitundrae]|uniref:cobalamin biosynthesis protein n=1 Tax=Deinococcus alpinitundrae TaxID=468913 RepID=UPI001ED970A3|nr:cobalamin biosynthesis protein [Deinococcus alpinitundrae]